MSNYAVSRPRTSMTPFLDQVQGFSPASRLLFDRDPDSAFEFWLNTLNLPQNYQTALRQMSQKFQNQHGANINAGGPQTSTRTFLDHMKTVNPGRELMRMQPQSRFDSPARFSGRVRTIAF